jgi:hypothetical protein
MAKVGGQLTRGMKMTGISSKVQGDLRNRDARRSWIGRE